MLTFHTDVVGSLLRPPELLKAREAFEEGRIPATELKTIEDRAVDEAVALQEEAGLDVVTDGEARRVSFQSQMLEAVEGFGRWNIDAFLWGDWRGDAVKNPNRPFSNEYRRPRADISRLQKIYTPLLAKSCAT